ncbi:MULTISPECIES: DUF432 domain-containing protein [unclassified Archaeoglobus]|uniref:DUF432 domain-containing protein n=1 Tax=unclassified Archaeoglobus TaxID=2643606 RepID=UPI0025C4FE4C|nr:MULTISPECIES: DUF432 domain-containing protein [unclassified Archaeoglobus]
MFGYHELSEFSTKIGKFSIRVEKNGNFYRYVRENGGRKEKNIFTGSGRLIINPVEPVNLPKEITNFLQIKFDKKFMAEPKSSTEVYLTFPIEIAIFVAAKRSVGLIDVFSLNKPKFTLYGDPRTGIICRYWESELYTDVPEVDKYREGVMKLRITNSDDDWVDVSSIVLDVYGMKIYYDDEMVYSAASMNVTSPKVAETRFIERPLRDKMKKALELYVARRIAVTGSKFVMEWGL